jgi:eukaryotic-like serine/threonine-protein kinase
MHERLGSSRYRVIRTIKRGPSSEVLEAIVQGEGALERRVAIKRLLDVGVPHEQFIDEARITSQLHHANIVDVYDFGVEDGQPYLVFEYIDGLDLHALIELAARQKKRMPLELALHITAEIAHALAHAHEARDRDGNALGIIHRDVNPNNILVSWTGDVRLTDFGIARGQTRMAQRTAVGLTKGTLHYMSPEQLAGGPVDARADIFSLGCVLHRLIAGYSPLEKISPPAEWNGELDADLPPPIAQIIQRATHPKARERYRDARAFAADCWRALTKRLDRDARSALVEWLATLKSSEPGNKKIRELFDAQAIHGLAEESPAPLKRPKTLRPPPADEAKTRFERPHLEDELPEDLEIRTMVGSELDTTVVSVPDKSAALTQGYELPDITPKTPSDLTVHAPLEPHPVTDPYLGKVLHGYRLTALLGTGSWTRVYRAEHQFLHYECAIKVAATTSKNIAARIMREAQELAKIEHPNLVSVLDCGITENGAPFFTMELIDGRTLHDALATEAPFSSTRARRLLRQIALGLSEAHRRGLVHRDLKPANVMLTGSGEDEQIKVLDFGLVRLLAPQSGADPLTAQNQIVGTPAYMSPEQIQAEAVGPESDLYALGVILFEMLAGVQPFRGLNVIDTMHQHLIAPPPALSPAGGLEELVVALLAKNANERIKTADELIKRLDALPLSQPTTPIDLEHDTVKPEPSRPERVRVTPVPFDGMKTVPASAPPSISRALSALEAQVESEPMVRAVGSELGRQPPPGRRRGVTAYLFAAMVVALLVYAVVLLWR